MNMVRGRVRNGHVDVQEALPEGAEVVVLVATDTEPFDLGESETTELKTAMAEADTGKVVPAEVLMDRLSAR